MNDAIPSPITPFPAEGRVVALGLPSPPSSFVGRQREVTALAALLRDPAVRLLTLTGPGGVGKTRLALEVAADAADGFADGVAFVGLADVHDPALLGPTIARRLEIDETGDRSPLDRLIGELRDRALLLVVDNLEHLLPATPLLTELLTACPDLKILATSRARLQLTAERVVPVEPLALPDLAAPPPVAELPSFDAVRLWVERARATNPAFALTPANSAVVATICHRLDGLPLAIELAAAWSRVLPPESILRRLERRLHLLTEGPRDAPPRLQTMRAAIAWSFDLLDPGERGLLTRLAVFTGGFTIDAAEQVGGPGGLRRVPRGESSTSPSSPSVLNSLAALVDKGLLQPRANAEGEPRLAMLETVREFGLEQLALAGEEAAIREAHAVFFLAFAETAGPALRGPDQTAWWNRIEAEIGNIRSALAWLRDAGRIDDALRLACGLGWFWTEWNYLTEGRRWYDELLAAEGQGDRRLRARAHLECGGLADLQADAEGARRLYEESLALWRAIGEPQPICDALIGLASVAADRSRLPDAEAYLTEALPLAERDGTTFQIARIHNSLGTVAALRGEWQRAALCQAAALRIWRSRDDFYRIVATLNAMGWAHLVGGDLPRAWESYDAALTLLLEKDFDHRYIHADCFNGFALIAGAGGSWETATRLLAAAAALRARIGRIPIHRQWQRLLDERAAEWEAALGGPAFAKAWAAGLALDPVAALGEARAVPKPAAVDTTGLSRRELEVLCLLVEGAADHEIAARLFISRKTASKHVAAILAKLGATNRTAAVSLAIRRGLV